MALPHTPAGQPVDVRPLGPRAADWAGAATHALFKARDLEVIRLVLRAGESLPPHRVPGELTVLCLEGRIAVELDGRSPVLEAGQLLYLDGGVSHGMRALADATALVTIALRP